MVLFIIRDKWRNSSDIRERFPNIRLNKAKKDSLTNPAIQQWKSFFGGSSELESKKRNI